MLREWIQTLRGLGINQALFDQLESHGMTVEQGSFLYPIIATAAQNGQSSTAYSKLFYFDSACAEWVRRDLLPVSTLGLLCTPGIVQDKASALAAEIIAGGLLGTVFTATERIPEKKNQKTPDLKLGPAQFAEVYCPQESSPESAKYAAWLAEAVGPINLFVSHPITGSSTLAMQYTANVVIDRAVSGKRDKNQFEEGAENLLWLDLLHGFGINGHDTKPFTSIHKGENTYVGSFGIWHSLYGDKGCSFASERTDLRYFEARTVYKQQRPGLFRERPEASAAVLLVSDGVLLFENPWTSTPLSEKTRQSLKRMLRFKPDLSYLAISGQNLEARINAILAEIEWLFTVTQEAGQALEE
jgi:hypothetical protein